MSTVCPTCAAPLPTDDPAVGCAACGWKPTPSGVTAPYFGAVSVVGNTATAETAPTAEAPPSHELILAALARRLPDYRDWERVGHGGMGLVWSAFQPVLNRRVAVKVMLPTLATREGFAERFAKEARAMADLDHPGIVRAYDFGEAEGVYFIVMEYQPMNLRQYRKLWLPDAADDAPGTPDMATYALDLFRELCEAIHFAHEKGYLHRDIKPENILVTEKDAFGHRHLKLADFGLARLHGSDGDGGGGSGTPNYMPSEQKYGEEDRSSDVYSLGVVLFEFLTGERPEYAGYGASIFTGSTRRRGAKLPAAPDQKLPSELGMDARIDRIVRKATSPWYEHTRYKTARELRDALAGIANYPRRSIRFWNYASLGLVCMCGGAFLFFSLSSSANLASYWNLLALWGVAESTTDFQWYTARLRRVRGTLVLGFVFAVNVAGAVIGGEAQSLFASVQTIPLVMSWFAALVMYLSTQSQPATPQTTERESLGCLGALGLCGGFLAVLYFAPPEIANWGPAVMTALLAAIWVWWEVRHNR